MACCCGVTCSGQCPCEDGCCCGFVDATSPQQCIASASCCTPALTLARWYGSYGPFPANGAFRLRIVLQNNSQGWSAYMVWDPCACKWYFSMVGCGFIGSGAATGSVTYTALVDPEADCLPPAGQVTLTLYSCFGVGCSSLVTPQVYVDKP
jgi:hypothetical protein